MDEMTTTCKPNKEQNPTIFGMTILVRNIYKKHRVYFEKITHIWIFTVKTEYPICVQVEIV